MPIRARKAGRSVFGDETEARDWLAETAEAPR